MTSSCTIFDCLYFNIEKEKIVTWTLEPGGQFKEGMANFNAVFLGHKFHRL